MNSKDKSCTARLVTLFERAVHDGNMSVAFQGGVLIALSGGADSVALTQLMYEKAQKEGFYIAACHVNHNIRGDEAKRDEDFCRELCRKMGIDFHLATEDVPALAVQSGRGLEETARSVRYAFFDKLLREDERLSCIVTAHNASDNTETVVLNMLRGSGTRGMCGIPLCRGGTVLRPLLYASKQLIFDAAQESGWDFVTDSTNSDDSYSRNFVRKNIVPLFSRLSDDPDAALSRMTRCLREDESFIEEESKRAAERIVKGNSASRSELSALHPAILARVLGMMFSRAAATDGAMLEYVHAERLAQLVTSPTHSRFSLDLPCSVRASGEYDLLKFAKKSSESQPERPQTPLTIGKNVLWNGECCIYLSYGRDEVFEQNYSNVYKFFIQADLSSAIISDKLFARTRREGDSYRCGGMTRKLKKMLSDRHYSKAWRDSLPLVCDSKGIVWVPGFGARSDIRKDNNKKGLYAYFCKAEGKDE